jgi:hypothetical protein
VGTSWNHRDRKVCQRAVCRNTREPRGEQETPGTDHRKRQVQEAEPGSEGRREERMDEGGSGERSCPGAGVRDPRSSKEGEGHLGTPTSSMSGQAGPPQGGPPRDDDGEERREAQSAMRGGRREGGRDKRARGREEKGEENEPEKRKGAWVFDRGKQPG